jgi:cold shock CspA family protein
MYIYIKIPKNSEQKELRALTPISYDPTGAKRILKNVTYLEGCYAQAVDSDHLKPEQRLLLQGHIKWYDQRKGKGLIILDGHEDQWQDNVVRWILLYEDDLKSKKCTFAKDMRVSVVTCTNTTGPRARTRTQPWTTWCRTTTLSNTISKQYRRAPSSAF